MKNLSTGTGIALLAGAIVSFPFINNIASNANASAVTAAAAAVSTAATAQAGPTIVWYGLSPASTGSGGLMGAMFRAWSDGRIEYRPFFPSAPFSGSTCDLYLGQPVGGCGWRVFADPAQGLTYRSDINFDEKVDGADLG